MTANTDASYGHIVFCADQGFKCPRCCDACLCTTCTKKRGEAYEGPRRSDSKRALPKRRADDAPLDSESDPTQHVGGSSEKRRQLTYPAISSASALPQATNARSPILDPQGRPCGFLVALPDGSIVGILTRNADIDGIDSTSEIDELEGDRET
ncbi:hypothetical protein PENSPDRAFT_280935 [Peniophora sp. CONT]|nr:hypothetical protein PENSPDRAFT_280935 [Peniophora sp. CONT]